MKRIVLIAFSILLVVLGIEACKKNGVPRKYADIGECHFKKTWDSTSIRAKLVGKWEWEYVNCGDIPDNGNDDEAEDNMVEFNDDGTGQWIVADKSTTDFTWEVVPEDNAWGIKTTPSLEHVAGKILFCDENLELNDSYLDGCDNYYERK